jgi:hypothetical protein
MIAHISCPTWQVPPMTAHIPCLAPKRIQERKKQMKEGKYHKKKMKGKYYNSIRSTVLLKTQSATGGDYCNRGITSHHKKICSRVITLQYKKICSKGIDSYYVYHGSFLLL